LIIPTNVIIFAMMIVPTININVYPEMDENDRSNRAVQDLYEPWSTFKVVTVSAALEEKVMSPTSLINTSPGRVQIGSRVVRENAGHNYGVLSLGQVIVMSSNVGA